METQVTVIEEQILENGWEIDLSEGWSKLASSQFKGTPGRAFSELIQNLIDSYPSNTPWKNRKGEINTKDKAISITDWGEGMDAQRLQLLSTVGGTDKYDDHSKIGKFGLGFVSIFNPSLETKQVTVITKCEGHVVSLIFSVEDPGKPPKLKCQIINKLINFSTRITIEFNNHKSVEQCIQYAKKSLKYYPCTILINEKPFKSVWKEVESETLLHFENEHVTGFVRKGRSWLNATILCKYELIMRTSLLTFINGGNSSTRNLVDFQMNKTPYLEGIEVLMNINNLNLTISRDNFYLDQPYIQAKRLMNNRLRIFLNQEIQNDVEQKVLFANHYIFREELKDYLEYFQGIAPQEYKEGNLLGSLINKPAYRLLGRPGLYSLLQLKEMLGPNMPLYYSPNQLNVRWVGGAYNHDFVVIPDKLEMENAPMNLFDEIFSTIFSDVVNLDTIANDKGKISELLMRGLISKAALQPVCDIKDLDSISEKHVKLIKELSALLNTKEIVSVIENNLELSINSIKPMYFSIEDQEAQISTALLDKKGNPITKDFKSNILEKKSEPPQESTGAPVDLLLGINITHPYVKFLVSSANRNRSYYTLAYLAQELTSCQKMLVLHSPFYHAVKAKLATDMRKVLLKNTINVIKN